MLFYNAPLSNRQLYEIKVFITWEIVFNIFFYDSLSVVDTPVPDCRNGKKNQLLSWSCLYKMSFFICHFSAVHKLCINSLIPLYLIFKNREVDNFPAIFSPRRTSFVFTVFFYYTSFGRNRLGRTDGWLLYVSLLIPAL
jgi:hypothetical protein